MSDKPQTNELTPEVRRRPKAQEQEPAATDAVIQNQSPAEGAEAAEAAPESSAEASPTSAGADSVPALSRRVVDVSTLQPPEESGPSPDELRLAEEQDEAAQAAEAAALADEFSALMSGGFAPAPTQKRNDLEEGQQVSGKIVHIGEDNVFIDVGAKTEGYLSRREVSDAEGELQVSVGEELDVYVVRFTASGLELTRGLSQSSDAEVALQNAFDSRIPVEGKVASRNKGGFEVTVLGERAFCPISQIEMAYTEDPDVHLGQSYRFLVTRFEKKGKNLDVVVSRAELEREERRAIQGETFATLEVGQVREGTVRKLMKFGAFVDLGGVDGLVHVSELSWDRVDNPAQVVQVGEQIKVKVLDIRNREAGPDKARISLSMKAAQGDPWEEALSKLSDGATVTGTVVRMEHFGAFVQLMPGIDGLVHISELSLSRVRHPSDVIQIGQEVQVQVLSVDPIRKRISLSMKSLKGNPWDTAAERYGEGLEVSGTVENIESFGVFVSVEPGITALIPLSELNTERGRDPNTDFRLGQTVEARVLSIEPERQRLTLTRRDADAVRADAEERSGEGRGRRDRDGERRGRDEGRRDGGQARRGARRGRDEGPKSWRDSAGSGKGGGMGTFADLFPEKLRRTLDKD